MAGTALQTDTLEVTEGDQLVLTATFGGQPVPTPATFWWPDAADGKLATLIPAPDGLSATLVMDAAAVDAMIADLAAAPDKRPQIDLGHVATLQYTRVKVNRTDRPNAAEEA